MLSLSLTLPYLSLYVEREVLFVFLQGWLEPRFADKIQ